MTETLGSLSELAAAPQLPSVITSGVSGVS